MKAKMTILATASFVVILGLTAAWLEFRSARRLEALLAQTARKEADLNNRIRSIRERITASKQDQTVVEDELRNLQAKKTAKKAPRHTEVATLLANDPKLHALYLQSYRAKLDQKYSTFLRFLGLSPQQIAKFEELMINSEEYRIDLKATEVSQGLADSDPAISALQQQQDSQLRAAEVDLLGQVGYQQIQQFNELQSASPLVNDVSRITAFGSDPLTFSQSMQLMNVVKNASGPDPASGKFDPFAMNRDQVITQAEGFLSAPQLAVLKADTLLAPLMSLTHQFYQSEAAAK